VRAAADAVGFSPSTLYALRRSRADFAEKWAKALTLAAERPAAQAESKVRYWRDGRAKRVRCFTQWSEEVEELFLDALAATCNVTIAAEQAQVGHTSVYRQRRLRADFAAKWQAALAQGYARLEMALVEAAVDSLEGVEFDADRPIPKMSAETALKVLQLHRAAVTGQGKSSGWKAPPRSVEHYRASIMRKIEAIRRGGAPEEGQ
jgi:FixJ family two-component response regulator